MTEASRRLSLSDLRKIRKGFGAGIAGKNAFRIIVKGADCEGLKDDGIKCGSKATKTIDFDVPRINELVQIASCIDCEPIIMEIIRKDCSMQGSTPSFGTNGMGRS